MAALGNLSPLVTASAAGGSISSRGLFLLNSVPNVTEGNLSGGFGYTAAYHAQINSSGLSKPATASACGSLGTLNNKATLNSATLAGGFGFTPVWPQNFLGTLGLKKLGTVWATGSLGLFFDDKTLNQAALQGYDAGLMPVSGTLSQSPLGVRSHGNTTAFGNVGYLLNGGVLTQSALQGADAGFMPLSGTSFQGSYGVAQVPATPHLVNAGISYLFGAAARLPTYLAKLSGTASLTKTVTAKVSGLSSTKLTYTSVSSGTAHQRVTFKAAPVGTISLFKTSTAKVSGSSSLYGTFNSDLSGWCTAGGIRYQAQLLGTAGVYSTFTAKTAGQSSKHSTFSSALKGSASNKLTFSGTLSGTAVFQAVFSRWSQPFLNSHGLSLAPTASAVGSLGVFFNTVHLNLAGIRKVKLVGKNALYKTYKKKVIGKSNARLCYNARLKGANIQLAQYNLALRGQTRAIYTHHAQLKGVARQAQAGLAGYLLYMGIDTTPDYSTPWQTFTNLPFTTPALAAGHTYQLALRQRNEFGLISQNGTTWTVTPSNPAILPSPPTAITLTQAAGGTVKLTANYDFRADGKNAATQFLIYLRSDGTTPNTATDTPVVVAAWGGGAFATLNYQSSAHSEGAVIKAIVRTRRTGAGGADSNNFDCYTVTATHTFSGMVKGAIIDAPNMGDNVGF